MRVSDLANRLDTSLAFVTTTLNVLEAKGIVSRNSHAQDNRAKIIRLTDMFRPQVDGIEKEVAQKLHGWLVPSIGLEDLEVYVNVIDKIARTEQ